MGEITYGVFVDLAKAFGAMNHSIFLTKLEHYGVRGNALSLLTSWSYLKNKTQFTQINHHASTNDIKLDDQKLRECAHFILCLVTLGGFSLALAISVQFEKGRLKRY